MQFGSGLVLLKDKKGNWSAPAAVATVGSGYVVIHPPTHPPTHPFLTQSPMPPTYRIGLQMGVEATDVVLFFRTKDAQDTFKGAHQVGVGLSGGLAVGPVGRTGSLNLFNRLGSKKMAYVFDLIGWLGGWVWVNGGMGG